MARFALINSADSSIIEFRDYPAQPANPLGKPRKWLPVVAGAPPTIDPLTEVATVATYTVNAGDVTETLGKRSMTAQEISDAKDTAVGTLNGGYSPMLKALFNINNRVRALEGQAPLTLVQFRAAIKALL
jgi:hypothetical protein